MVRGLCDLYLFREFLLLGDRLRSLLYAFCGLSSLGCVRY